MKTATELWDVYIWSITNAGIVSRVAKDATYEEAMKVYDKYLSGNMYDAYIVPSGTQLY